MRGVRLTINVLIKPITHICGAMVTLTLICTAATCFVYLASVCEIRELIAEAASTQPSRRR